MIEGFLGEEPFREGIRQYMRKHARGNAVADDLWRALARGLARSRWWSWPTRGSARAATRWCR